MKVVNEYLDNRDRVCPAARWKTKIEALIDMLEEKGRDRS